MCAVHTPSLAAMDPTGAPAGTATAEAKLRRYEKISFLGEGQFATVYKVS